MLQLQLSERLKMLW